MMLEKTNNPNDSVSIIKNIFKINYDGESIQKKVEQFFSSISNLCGLKENLYRALDYDGQINILLVGPNITLKSMLILHIKEQCSDVFYFDASTTHGSKLIDELHNNRLAKVIIIDNIDKLRKNYLDSLHGFLDDGHIVQTLKTKKKDFKMENIKIFATSKGLEKFSPQLRSRFQEFLLP